MDQETLKDCGCDCEFCKAGQHEECKTGMCERQDDNDEPTALED